MRNLFIRISTAKKSDDFLIGISCECKQVFKRNQIFDFAVLIKIIAFYPFFRRKPRPT